MDSYNSKKFNDLGFMLFSNMFPKNHIKTLSIETNYLRSQNYETGISPDKVKFQKSNSIDKIHSQCNVWKSNTTFMKTVISKKLGETAAKLMNWEGVKVNQDTLFTVSPGYGPTTFHQDNPYQDWHTSNGVITAIIALKKVTKDMGSLIFIPESHLWKTNNNRIKTTFIGSKEPSEDLDKALIENNISHLKKEYIEMEAGDISFHHGNLWHGSGLNNSTEDRITLSIHFMQHNAIFKENINNPWFSRYKLNKTLEMSESFFPLCWKQ